MKIIRIYLCAFITLLVLSGITAFPLRTEIQFLMTHLAMIPVFFHSWIAEVDRALKQTPEIVLYGSDWLAFAHIIIALFFIPVLIDPVRYKANLLIAMAACILVFVLAFICGPVRGIPFFHQMIDCSFGFLGFWPLLLVYKKTNVLEKLNAAQKQDHEKIK